MAHYVFLRIERGKSPLWLIVRPSLVGPRGGDRPRV